MNTKTKLLYVGFRALSTCCLYAAFLMITSCGDNVVNPDSPEPDGEDMIPVTISRVEDGSYMESHVDTPDTTGGRTLVDEWGAGERATRQQGHTGCRALRGAFSGTDDAPRRATSHYPCRYIGQRHLFPVDRFP